MKDFVYGGWTFQFSYNAKKRSLESVAYRHKETYLVEPIRVALGAWNTLIRESKKFSREVRYIPGKGWCC